jgi:electron transport complex protein RnfG
MSPSVRLVIVLFVVCGLAAGSLAFVNAATKDRIAAFALTEKTEAMKAVLPQADEFAELQPGKVWEARRAGEKIGYVLGASAQGYSGPIGGVVGMDPQGAVTGVKVLVQTETPGLGAKIAGAKFLAQFRGLKAGELALKKDDPAGRIDAVTAATISSRALTTALRKSVDSFEQGGQK